MSDIGPNTLHFLCYISKYIFPKCAKWFVFYMVWNFYKINKRKAYFSLKQLNKKVFLEILRTYKNHKLMDINTTVIINPALIFMGERLIKLLIQCNGTCIEKIALVAPSDLCALDCMIVSDIFIHNITSFKASINKPALKVSIRSLRENAVAFATDLDISFLPSPSVDLDLVGIHAVLKNYLSVPRLLHKGDLIEINLNIYGKELYYNTSDGAKIKHIEQNIYINCCKLMVKDKVVNTGLCLFSHTTTRQLANVAMFLPSITEDCWTICGSNNFHLEHCPAAMRSHFNDFKRVLNPFLSKSKISVYPVFLVTGSKGDGKETIVQELAASIGLNYYKIDNIDLTANVYAQNETKLTNTFYTAMLSAPCLLAIHNFENFGKNNEGEYDERLIGHFEHEIALLFQNKSFPVILFCCSNTKDIPACLKRLFLEVFHLDAPSEKERENIIKWFMMSNKINYNFNIKLLANHTNGFLYEDLKALVQNAYLEKLKTDKSQTENNILNEEDMMKSLDRMHAIYNRSLGAPKVPKVQWTDIGGLTEVKEEIIKTINLPLKHPNLMKLTGLKRSGILLFGPPGTGKTLLAKAIATECGLCFLSVKGPELLNKYVGQSEQNIRQVFEKARQASPCIVFFDELDSLAPNRGRSGDSGGVMDRIVSQLLAEMDGLNEAKTVFTIGATNRPDLIDPALLRPGRFDKLLYVGPCTDTDSKVSVLKAQTQKFNLAKNVNLDEIVHITPNNITGADFYGICSNAWSSAVRRLISKVESDSMAPNTVSADDVIVEMEDFKYALQNAKPSISKKDLLYFEKLKNELSSNI